MTGQWRGMPGTAHADGVRIVTAPRTDLWQRTFYGFRVANASAYTMRREDNVTFSVDVSFEYGRRFDQAGVLVWVDEDNWFKAAIEYENATTSRLGSVLTTAGYSDWATTDIPTTTVAGYRLSRRGPDFLLEARHAGGAWEQLRIFHVQALGPTTADMAAAPAAELPAAAVDIGVYAASPEDSSFTADFTHLAWRPSQWSPHL